jgi:hypothetical protein
MSHNAHQLTVWRTHQYFRMTSQAHAFRHFVIFSADRTEVPGLEIHCYKLQSTHENKATNQVTIYPVHTGFETAIAMLQRQEQMQVEDRLQTAIGLLHAAEQTMALTVSHSLLTDSLNSLHVQCNYFPAVKLSSLLLGVAEVKALYILRCPCPFSCFQRVQKKRRCCQ